MNVEKLLTDFILHYETPYMRDVYKKWKPEDIAKTFVGAWEKENKSDVGDSFFKNLNSALPELSEFKKRRERSNLSLREVAKTSKVSAATISRIENGKPCDFVIAKKLHEFYLSIGV